MRRSVVGLAALALVLGGVPVRAEGPSVVAVAGQPTLLLSGFDLAPFGYATSEFFVSGTATSYKLASAATADGRWHAVPAATTPFATRIVVVRPTDPKKFSGTVVVEWMNVTGGADGTPDWNMAHREIMRSGHAYVAVSAQKVGVEGGPSLLGTGTPLKKTNPERYGRLNHPGDGYSYDIFSQAGRVVRTDAGTVLGPLVPKRVIAIGESQSAAFLTTYVNAVDPLAKVYDGFLIHSRFGSAASLENATMNGAAAGQPKTVQLRTPLRVPVITVVMETDVLDGRIPGFHGARQPDNERLRIWEVPGTAHADNYTFTVGRMDTGKAPVDQIAAGYECTSKILGMELAKPVNNAPQHHYLVQSALWHVDRWIRTGHAPPKAAPMTMKNGEAGAPASFALDANGLAQGGVRTPWVDVPTARLSGVGNSGGPLAFLVGVCEPFDAATLDRLYPGGKREYLKRFEASLTSAVKAGFILAADKQEILAIAGAMTYRGSR